MGRTPPQGCLTPQRATHEHDTGAVRGPAVSQVRRVRARASTVPPDLLARIVLPVQADAKRPWKRRNDPGGDETTPNSVRRISKDPQKLARRRRVSLSPVARLVYRLCH